LEKNISILAKAIQVSDVAHWPLVFLESYDFAANTGMASLEKL
jgi:hypothetical protein